MARLEKEILDVIQRYRKLFKLTEAELHTAFDRAVEACRDKSPSL